MSSIDEIRKHRARIEAENTDNLRKLKELSSELEPSFILKVGLDYGLSKAKSKLLLKMNSNSVLSKSSMKRTGLMGAMSILAMYLIGKVKLKNIRWLIGVVPFVIKYIAPMLRSKK